MDTKNASTSTEEIDRLKREIEMLNYTVEELKVTNDHLVSATWREREMKEELRRIKETLEYRSAKINESISYAKNIQQSMITNECSLQKSFSNALVFYKPRDVVSGDFPWSYTHDDTVFFAAVDCTGHGVPGAMLAIVGNILLDNLCYFKDNQTDEVLNRLHDKMVKVLRQKAAETNINDGLDIAICKYLIKDKKMQFTGAHRPLFVMRKSGELVEIKGDRQAIGGVQGRKARKPFTRHTVDVEQGDRVYLFSDGYTDQFNEENKLKMGSKRLRELLIEHHDKSMDEVRKILASEWKTWKGNAPQTDDVLMMGVEI